MKDAATIRTENAAPSAETPKTAPSPAGAGTMNPAAGNPAGATGRRKGGSAAPPGRTAIRRIAAAKKGNAAHLLRAAAIPDVG